jgi:hypothetical protein
MTAHDRALHMPDKHRSWLERPELVGDGVCVFNGLNPSTASAERNDPTITREIGFSRRLGCRLMVKVNLFTARATKPENLWAHDDPIGPDADDALDRALALIKTDRDRFICAWGGEPSGAHGLKEMYRLRVRQTLARAKAAGVPLWCLGFTESGAPRHPLYIPKDEPLVPYGRAA